MTNPTPDPTNSAIAQLITINHQDTSQRLEDIATRLDGVEVQVKKTNGRVTTMERKWERQETIENYKKEFPTAAPIVTTAKINKIIDFDAKTVLTIISTLALVIYALVEQLVRSK